ncbi:MAG: hypothetical protein MUO88_13250 [Desulfobacterales bacterium]|nr:hypothetical protein [Desulfobacterales bacterium]
MKKQESYGSELLKIEVIEKDDSIEIKWTGKSTNRSPSKFITPILVNVLKVSSEHDKRIVLDFRKLDYMNSSTITPVIKVLERAKKGKTQVSVIYSKALKWQDLNFSALKLFETKDKRVEIIGD